MTKNGIAGLGFPGKRTVRIQNVILGGWGVVAVIQQQRNVVIGETVHVLNVLDHVQYIRLATA